MKIFQNFDVYPEYQKYFHQINRDASYEYLMQSFIEDRFVGVHMLQSVENGRDEFAVGNDAKMQRMWRLSKGSSARTGLETLLEQIEDSKADVFYNMDPVGFDSAIIKRLPGNVKHSIAWRAAPLAGADLTKYDLVVCNFPGILRSFRELGCETSWFAPAYDSYANVVGNPSRLIDIAFVGTYSRHHKVRSKLIEKIASLSSRYNVALHLQYSRLTNIARKPVVRNFPWGAVKPSESVETVARPPVYGLKMFEVLSQAKIVVNAGIDMSKQDKGNMRCWETLSSGACLVTDQGNYPEGFAHNETVLMYEDLHDFDVQVDDALNNSARREAIADRGRRMLATKYSKDQQQRTFETMVASL